jgi:hypothetical protein
MIGQPALIVREQRLSMGIRTIAPFRGLFVERAVLLKELRSWVQQHTIADEGPFEHNRGHTQTTGALRRMAVEVEQLGVAPW